MKDDLQLIKYKKENFFVKIKNKILNIFSKNENTNDIIQSKKNDILGMSKEMFFDTYEKVKKQEISIDTLDKQTIKKILLMTIEELNINSEKINQKLNNFETSLDNIKIYNKEIEMLKKANN